MSFTHSMHSRTEGIRPLAPVTWRNLDGIAGVFWTAEGEKRARGYYVSPDPRIVVFFNDVSSHIRTCGAPDRPRAASRPMRRVTFVPAGMPLWTEFAAGHRFSHLDLHLNRDRMLRFLAPALGGSAAQAALRRPVEAQDVAAIETLAKLLVRELREPVRHGVHAECLAGSIVTALLDLPAEPEEAETAGGPLTKAQMGRLAARIEAKGDRRLTVAEMAATVGLSESWFTARFKRTTGQTPLQWQLAHRVAAAKQLLLEGEPTVAAVASQLGFADQAHFTRVFRQIAGETPAAWRRLRQGADGLSRS
ncbi:helix-turn-helix domain-containing protein [Jiella sonneratiae]|uniref:Helix-turn-helix transcriptional regulator n=1 Tax=Jiella sonneratiae TaxID=2816856 RepID=A0ABS3J0N9_9HYPH|nr:AraC family transcriptional regulator [Jiella sonneratiae]MBO0903228.1 helix-turn-helix transcriptional regulator [Jiella sonneratiae]